MSDAPIDTGATLLLAYKREGRCVFLYWKADEDAEPFFVTAVPWAYPEPTLEALADFGTRIMDSVADYASSILPDLDEQTAD